MTKTHEQKLAEVSERIYKLVPRLRELSFGCEVGISGLTQRFDISDFFSEKNKILPIYSSNRDQVELCRIIEIKKDPMKSYFILKLDKIDDYINLSDIEILNLNIIGHPILPHHLLFAIREACDQNWMMKTFGSHFELVDMTDYGTSNFKNKFITIHNLPLSEQTPETIDFLYSLFFNQDK